MFNDDEYGDSPPAAAVRKESDDDAPHDEGDEGPVMDNNIDGDDYEESAAEEEEQQVEPRVDCTPEDKEGVRVLNEALQNALRVASNERKLVSKDDTRLCILCIESGIKEDDGTRRC